MMEPPAIVSMRESTWAYLHRFRWQSMMMTSPLASHAPQVTCLGTPEESPEGLIWARDRRVYHT